MTIIGGQTPEFEGLSLVESDDGYVAVRHGETVVIGVYISSSKSLTEYERVLGKIEVVINRLQSSPAVVLRDFNAKSVLKESPRTDAKGEALDE